MKLGLGLGLGSGNSLPRYVTDYFNGFELSGSTYSGGPTVVADNTGALVTSPADVLPLEGMRVADAVAVGSVDGFFDNYSTKETLNTDDGTKTTEWISIPSSGRLWLLPTGGTAERRRIQYKDASGTIFYDSVNSALDSVVTKYPYVYVAPTGAVTFRVYYNKLTSTATGFSTQDPTWLPTTSLGAPIHPSTPLRTRKGTVSVYGENFRGPLVEPARTNLLLASNNIMDTTAWTTDNVLTEIESTVKYKGNNTNKITVTSTDNNHYFYPSSILITPGIAYTLHAFFKKGNGNFIQIMFGGSRFGLEAYANVDLSDGSFGSIGASITRSIITDMGDGWYLVEITATATSSGTSVPLAVAAIPAKDDVRMPSFLGAGEVFYYYNLQFEVGSFATSPIITAATTVTRPAANLTRPTAGTALAALNNWAIRARFRPTAAGQTAVLWGSYTDADNATRLDLAPTTLTYTKRLAGADHVAQASLTHAADTLYEALIYQHSVHGMGIATRSWSGSAWSAWSTWVDLTDANGIANASIAATYQNGAVNNSSHVCANLPFIEVIAIPASVEPQAWLMDQLSKGRV